MARYHVKADGSMGVCHAKDGNCPFGNEEGTRHFTNKAEAQKYSEAQARKASGAHGSMKKTKAAAGSTGRAAGQSGPLKATTPDQKRLNGVTYGGDSQKQWETQKADFDKYQKEFSEQFGKDHASKGGDPDAYETNRQWYMEEARADEQLMQAIGTLKPGNAKEDREIFKSLGVMHENEGVHDSLSHDLDVSYEPSRAGKKGGDQDYWVNKDVDYLGKTEDGNLVVVRYSDRTIGGDKSVYSSSGSPIADRVWTRTYFEVIDPKSKDSKPVATVQGPNLSREDRNDKGYVDLDSLAKVMKNNGSADKADRNHDTLAHSADQFHGLSDWLSRRAQTRANRAKEGFTNNVWNRY